MNEEAESVFNAQTQINIGLMNDIAKLQNKLSSLERLNESVIYLSTERMKQLEIINKAIFTQYKTLYRAFSSCVTTLEQTAKSVEILDGYTNSEISSMSSDEYYSKVLKPLGVRNAKSDPA